MTFTEDKKKQFESDELIEKIIAICADSLINEDDVAGLYIAGLRKELRKVIKPFKEAQEEAVRKFVRPGYSYERIPIPKGAKMKEKRYYQVIAGVMYVLLPETELTTLFQSAQKEAIERFAEWLDANEQENITLKIVKKPSKDFNINRIRAKVFLEENPSA